MRRYLSFFMVGLLALSVGLPAAGQSKKKKAAGNSTDPEPRHKEYVDISKVVWPNPPAVPRIKFLEIKTGQKIDPNMFSTKNRKSKQKWMDRLAGSQSADQIDTSKLPFQLIRPYGTAVDSKGTIYIADQGVSAIFMFDNEGGVNLIKNKIDAHFGLINGLAIDDDDRLFVSDVKMNRVVVFNAKHEMQGNVGGDILSDPAGIAIDAENRFLYVVDTGNDVVRVFDADTYKLLRTIGVAGKNHTLTDPGTFSLPSNVAVDGDGNVYVTDTFNDRVEIFDADGTFITQFGKNGDSASDFERPKGIAVDCDGHIWVVDGVQMRVKVYNQQGLLLIYFGGPGYYPGQFGAPYGITIDKQSRVVVTETFPGRSQVFQYVSDEQFEKEKQKRAEAEKPKAPVKPTGGSD